MRRLLLALLPIGGLFLVHACGAAESPPAAPGAGDAAALRTDIDKILAEADLGKMVVAVRVVALPDGAAGGPPEVVYSVRAADPLIPASTMKLVTTAACLDRLGPDWRLRTYVGRLPAPGPAGACDLGVVGGGDPNFSGRFYGGDVVGALRRWAEILKSRGVKAVGRLILDDTLFDPTFVHPHWPADQRGEWYEAPVSALGLNDNCVDVHVAPGAVGGPARVWVDPAGAGVAVENGAVTVADRKDHRFGLERVADRAAPAGIRIRASGRVWSGADETIEARTVVDPTMFFGAALADTLRAGGIAVAGPVVRGCLVGPDGQLRKEFTCDLVHASPLVSTITVANKRSQGFYAECLLKLLGAFGPTPASRAVVPRQGSWDNGTEEARRWLADRGIPAAGCVIDDGSGLSKENRLSAFCVSQLLVVMHGLYGETFVRTLAVAGDDGSLRKRLRNTPAEGRIHGKTGYVLGASALSGYARTSGGRLLAFSILMNEVPWGQLWKARLAQDKICVRLVAF